MKPWQILFREAPAGRNHSQGASTGDEDFTDEAADEAAALEGEAELDAMEEEGDGDEEAESEEDDDDQSEEDQDDDEDEEEEEEEEQEEEAPAKGFKFKDPKSGDFDFKRIDKVLGGSELSDYFKEQNATITRISQENASFKKRFEGEEFQQLSSKASFIDQLYDSNPVIRREVNRILGIQEAGGAQGSQPVLPQGVDPNDPLVKPFLEVQQLVQQINGRLSQQDRAAQQREVQAKIAGAVDSGATRFSELTGKKMTPEQRAILQDRVQKTGYLDAAELIPGLFYKEIQDAAADKARKMQAVKRKLPQAASSRAPAPGKGKKRISREEERERLWDEHMGSDD